MATATTTVDARLVAPGSLVIAANVRSDTKVDKTFVTSIKQHGVLVPLDVEEVDGVLNVIDGQRRTLAALEAGLEDVPIIVRPKATDEQTRIIEQLVVNDHRAELSETEHTGAYKQLALFGVSADSIARKTGAPKKRVELAIDVAGSEVASKLMVDSQLTLDEAAAVLEFEDNPEDVAALAEAAATGQFEHRVSQIRDRRKSDAVRDDIVRQVTNEGLTLVDEVPEYYYYAKGPERRLSDLYADQKAVNAGNTLNPETHKDCPGHAVAIEVGWGWDGNDRVVKGTRVYLCTDFQAHGHLTRGSSSSAGKPEAGSKEAEEQAAKRKLTIANNKLWRPATEVRIAFVKDMLQRSEPPADWQLVTATHFLEKSQPDSGGTQQVQAFLGVPAAESLSAWLKSNPKKAGHLLVAMYVAFHEGQYEFGKSGWRGMYAKEYLAQLSAWGYGLSDIEERVVKGTAQKVQA